MQCANGKPAECCRASELFDWLRGLPDAHELAHLCDVYTYTTIISQCGSHQQLRKALELVAEMRGHGIQCNVHTYSALMNVCIKARRLCHPHATPALQRRCHPGQRLIWMSSTWAHACPYVAATATMCMLLGSWCVPGIDRDTVPVALSIL